MFPDMEVVVIYFQDPRSKDWPCFLTKIFLTVTISKSLSTKLEAEVKCPKSVTCCIIPGQWNLWNRQMCETPTPYLPFNWRFGSCCHNHAWSYTSTKQQQQQHNRLKACPNLGKRYAGKFNAGFISVHHAEEAINITYLFTKKKKKYIEYLINRRNKIMINYSQEKRCYILDPGGVWIGGTILLQQLYSQSILQSQ